MQTMQAARKGGIRAGDGNSKAEQEANNSSMTAITSRRLTLSISLWVSLFSPTIPRFDNSRCTTLLSPC